MSRSEETDSPVDDEARDAKRRKAKTSAARSGAWTPCLTRSEAAEYLRISTRTLDRLHLPRSRIGAGRVVYLIPDLEAYLQRSRFEESRKMRSPDSPVAQPGPRRSMARVHSRSTLPAPNPNWLDDALRVLKKG